MEYELYHHGILGMKWGIRRYQNPDGSLTPAGRKRYQNADGDKIYKDLKRQVQNKRSELYGWASKHMHNKEIGNNSKKVIDLANANREKWANTKEFKDWSRKLDNFDRLAWKKVESGEMTGEEYSKKYNELFYSRPPKNFNDTYHDGKELKGNKWLYSDDYINRGGADLSKAYLTDLGYDKKTVEFFIKKMTKAGRTLGDI